MGEFYLGQRQNYKRRLIGKLPPQMKLFVGEDYGLPHTTTTKTRRILLFKFQPRFDSVFFFNFNVSNKFCQDKIFLKVEKNYRLFSVGRQYKHFISLEPPHRKFGHGNIFTACCRPFQNRGLKVATIICFFHIQLAFLFRR